MRGRSDGCCEGTLAWAIEEPGYAHEVAFACEKLGDIAVHQGDRQAAEEYYRRVLIDNPTLDGTTGCVEISLAELLLDTRREPGRDEALALLNSWLKRPGMKLDSQLFRWHLVLIRLAEQTGDCETARRAANWHSDWPRESRNYPGTRRLGSSRPNHRLSADSASWPNSRPPQRDAPSAA